MSKRLKVLSLFDGISAGRVALNRAGIPVAKYYASEIDKYAISVTQKNFPDTIQLGDATKWKNWDIDWKSIDILIGGSPCTSFSNAGTRTGFNGESGLFYTYLEILNHLKSINPNIKFLLENVKMKKEWRDEITRCMGVEPVLINSALVSAQQRNRYYWCNWQVEQPKDKGILLKDILENDIDIVEPVPCALRTRENENGKHKNLEIKQDGKANSLTSVQTDSMVCEPIRVGQIGKGGQGQRIYSIKGKSVALSANGGGQGAKTGLYKIDLPDGDYIVRKLTPIEAERLQTFDDNYTAIGQENGKEVKISNTQRYKMIGNSWTVDVIAWLFKGLN